MGKDVSEGTFTSADRMRYRQKVRRCLDTFALMLDDFAFDADAPTTGLEIEINLVDGEHEPAMRNLGILEDLEDPTFQPELGQFNLELNVPPQLIGGDGLAMYEKRLLETLARTDAKAAEHDANLVLIGILPTLTVEHAILDNLSTNPRYRVLNEQILNARGEHISLDIRGVDHLKIETESIAPEAACTSLQFHLQVSPEKFANYWNAAQSVVAFQLAAGANSPYLFGHQLWHETRIALFKQATDTRPDELRAQGVRPRVWFGERWITSIFDLFEENVRYFPPLLPICDDEDPLEVLRSGGVPHLGELRLHNGTIYRWNRPVYDVMNGRPHLRVENRVMPAGPTIVDMMANAALYYGLVRYHAEQDRPIWTQLSFSAAEDNFHAAARRGIAAPVFWPGVGEVRATDLLLDVMLANAAEGLDGFGVDAAVSNHLLGIIEQRCLSGRTGATWQVDTVRAAERRGMDRPAALRHMLTAYAELSRSNAPVHTWPVE
ncbi:gamma-glutamyl:cysteine ligase YbdK (ATP-grasp superfamily) [Hamadaea flava]|uniref:Glutamate--cysteine ligase n=1 Tax=Hamadaea flava TaxID=1742688 RepID=A0ABV8LGB8_9ACTN|nr:glutamate--cysteine ligase [Hamadaea flava]MCP2326107.1 gamma-glutamyl:cysteine ligase YbdK (ATP-grasp superfamily) [Hamadaea flava]